MVTIQFKIVIHILPHF